MQCGGVVVNPGDWLVGDEDGVVAIPAARLQDAIQSAERILEAESRIAKAIRAGEDIGAILQYDAVLERKSKEVFIPQLRAAVKRS